MRFGVWVPSLSRVPSIGRRFSAVGTNAKCARWEIEMALLNEP
jgi:hypothetical protein